MRRLGALALALLGLQLASGEPASAAGPEAVAWWSVAHTALGAPPAPPDVAPGQLLVQGATPGSGIEGAPPLYQAVAALRFTVAPEQTVGALVVELASAPPVPPVLKACRADAGFAAVENGAWADVPDYDCADEIVGTTAGPVVTFDGVARLVRDGRLSVVLLPVEPTRVVIAAPDNRALDTTDPYAAPLEPPADIADFGAFGPLAPAPDVAAPLDPLAPVPADVADVAPEPVAPATADAAANPFPAGSTTRNPFEESSFGAKVVTAAVVFAFLAPFAFTGRRSRSRRSPA